MPTLEEIAQYRPGVLSRLTNVLTGGLAGYVTGTTQRGEEAARARQMLSQEELMDREMQRRAERMRFENALQGAAETGLANELGPNAKPDIETLQRMVAQKAQENRVAAAKGALYGAGGQTVEPSPEASNPFFQQAALNAQAQIAQQKQIRSFDDAKELAVAKAFLTQQKVPIEGRSDADILADYRVRYPAATATTQATAFQDVADVRAGNKAREFLIAEQNRGSIPKNVDVRSLSNSESVAMMDSHVKNLPVINRQLAVQMFNEDPSMENFASLPRELQKNPAYMAKAGIRMASTPKQIADADKAMNGFEESMRLARSIESLVGPKGDVYGQSAALFNAPRASIFNTATKIFGANSPQAQQIEKIRQEFSGLIAGDRNTLFGASLTPNELEEARSIFGNPNSANFLPSALRFIDKKFGRNPFSTLTENNYYVPDRTIQNHANLLSEWNTIKSKFPSVFGEVETQGGPVMQQSGPGVTNRIRIDARGNRIQ